MFNQVLLTVVCCSFGYVAPSSVKVNVLQLVNMNSKNPGPSVTLPKDINNDNSEVGPCGPTTSEPCGPTTSGSNGPTIPEPVTYPTTTDSGSTIDDLSNQELWLGILLQFDNPYGDRSLYRGESNYEYNLETENKFTNRSSSQVTIPAMKDFTSGKGRFKKLLNYPKGRDSIPAFYDPGVKEAIFELHSVYKENPGAKGILKVAVNAKGPVNEYIHMVTLNRAIVYDKELFGFSLPALYDVVPELFANTNGCNKPGAECCQIPNTQNGDYPPNLTENEWKLSYWREDAGFNDFHGSWHYYNTNAGGRDNKGGVNLTQGELFYYFHNQLLARYDMERYSNGLDPVEALDEWSSSYLIPQNYIPPVLTDSFFNLTRCANANISTWIFETNLTTARTNLENAIKNNTLRQTNNRSKDIQNDDGIKYVGCALERANCGEIDNALYGGPPAKNPYGIHGNGHHIISSTGCTKESKNIKKDPPYNVMASDWCAVRDPLFFRWHKFVDNTFQLNKKNIENYTLLNLGLDDVSVQSVGVESIKEEGQLYTFDSVVEMRMWFGESSSTCINQKTIDHKPFTYHITVNNNDKEGKDIDVNVRIFLAPKQSPALSYEELRTQWALMDRFNVTLKNGSNILTRNSSSSSITAPRPKPIQQLINIYSDEKSLNDLRYTFDGPLNKTWGENQCNQHSNQTRNITNQSLDQCKLECFAIPDSGCTAINYNPDTKDCVLRNCTVGVGANQITNVTEPEDYSPPLQGYKRITKPTTCQCGLPEHLLIPRGNEAGMLYQLFVYLTPRNNVQYQSPSGCPNRTCSELCSQESTGCDQSDGEVMGFPFDRPLTKLNITSIKELDNKLPNAKLHDIKIFYDKKFTK